MSKKVFFLNIVMVFFDVLLGITGIALFGWAAWNFSKWWLCLFALIPLTLYNTHGIIIESDMYCAEAEQEGDQDGNK